jgi:hypothetical protein
MAAAGAEEKAAAGSINRAAATASQSVPRMWLTLCEVVMRHRSICRSVPGGSRRAAADESSATSNEQSHGGGSNEPRSRIWLVTKPAQVFAGR